jgi:glutaredoxin
MYIQKGCPHCEAAKTYFVNRKISVESIEIGFDPILAAGIRSLTNGAGYQVPLTISYGTEEVVAGNDPIQLQRVADALVGPVPSTSDSVN